MRVGIVSPDGMGLPWWVRLHDEGNEVRVWNKDPLLKGIGDGLVPKAGQWPELLAWLKDGMRSAIPTMLFLDFSGCGELAEEARRAGIHVVGGGAFADRLEKDRLFGFRVAEEAGAKLPPYKEFGTVTAALAYAQSKEFPKGGAYFKTDRFLDSDATRGTDSGQEMAEYLEGVRERYGDRIKNIIQEKIPGIALSTARWWNGKTWTGPFNGAYENKKLMNDDVGGSTGCSFNAVWFYDDDMPHAAAELGWPWLEAAFLKGEATPGIYDMNSVIDESGDAWFLEWTPRLGYDSELTSQQLIPNLSEWLWAVATGQGTQQWSGDLAYGVHLSVPPYPWRYVESPNAKGSPVGLRVRGVDGLWQGRFVGTGVKLDPKSGQLVLADLRGDVGAVCATGGGIEDLNDECIRFAKDDLHIPGLAYRTDGGKDCAKAAEKLALAGVEVHPSLLD